MGEVEELLKEGKRLGLQLKGLPKLISMMAQARSFNMRARRALKRGVLPTFPSEPDQHHVTVAMTYQCMPAWHRESY